MYKFRWTVSGGPTPPCPWPALGKHSDVTVYFGDYMSDPNNPSTYYFIGPLHNIPIAADPNGSHTMPLPGAPQYNLRFAVDDQCNGDLVLTAYIAGDGSVCANAFDVWDANLVFTYSNNLTLKGTDPWGTDGRFTASNFSGGSYMAMKVTDPSPNTADITIAHSTTAGPYKTVSTLVDMTGNTIADWTPVAQIKFTKASTGGPYNFSWYWEYPSTGPGYRTIVYIPPMDVPNYSKTIDQGVILLPSRLLGLLDNSGDLNAPPTSAVLKDDATICNGDWAYLSVDFTGGSGAGLGPYIVTLKANGVDMTPTLSYTSGNSIPVNPTTTTTYEISSITYDGNCTTTVGSGTPVVTVNPHPTATITGDNTICNGDNTDLSITFTGTAPFIFDIDGATHTAYAMTTTVNVHPTLTTTYHVTALTDAHCTGTGADLGGSVVVTVNPRPTASLAGDKTICIGTSTTLTVTVTTTAGPWTGTLTDGTTFGSSTSPFTVLVSPTTTTTYHIATLINEPTGCSGSGSDLTGGAVVTVNTLSDPPMAGSDYTICRGGDVSLSLSPSGAIGTGGHVVWFKGSCGDGASDYVSLDNPYLVNPTTTTTYYGAYYDPGACDHTTTCATFVVHVEDVKVAIKVYLQGPWNGTNMNAWLHTGSWNYLPTSSPYNTSSTPAYPGADVTLGSIPSNNNIVDWIVVGLRDGSTFSSTTGWKSGFLMNNGSIKDVDASSDLALPAALINHPYYIVVVHRNHLGVLSNGPVSFDCSLTGPTTSYDFTTGNAYRTAPGSSYDPQVYFAPPYSTAAYAMWAGDATAWVENLGYIGDGSINAADWYDWYYKNGLLGYYGGDMNLDTSTDSFDTNSFWAPNNGRMSQALRNVGPPFYYVY
jgi:hypothetical protein